MLRATLSVLSLALTAAIAVLATAASAGGSARPSEARATLTVSTSLGPVGREDTRELRARGRAPRGSKLFVRFERGERSLGVTRPEVVDGRYAAAWEIDRPGDYRVRVTATTRSGRQLRVSAKLLYGPKAKAPSAG